MEFEPYIVTAAERYTEMRRAFHARGEGRVDEEHKRYTEAVDAAYRQSGLELVHVDYEGRIVDEPDEDGYSMHGTDSERDRVRLRIYSCAIELMVKAGL